jgi:thiamine biosynthesis lipoprotein
MTTKAFEAMGSRITVVLDGGENATASALETVPQWFEDWESVLSRFRAGSELSQLQSRSGKNLEASPMLCAVLAESLRAAEYTDGLVTPLVLDALRAAGYEDSFDEKDFYPAPNPGAVIHIPDWRAIRCSPSRGRVNLPRGSHLDLGGIAKGWAASQAAALLSRHGPALVDAGGDIAVSGPREDGSPWPVGVGNPFAPSELLFTIALSAGGIATSGRDYRKWIQAGRPRHHIIDPRTGEPAETDVLAATVVGPDPCMAEAGAKAAFILGSRDGIDWLDRHPELAGMLVLDDRRIEYSREFSKFVWN